MRKRRFQAPERAHVGREVFSHSIFARYAAFLPLLNGTDWPSLNDLNDLLHANLDLARYRFVKQDRQLLADGLHYETRIAERGMVATRGQNWHDLFNAWVWCRYPAIKQALNARQVQAIAQMGPARRNRAQYALTQFDEAGVIVRVRDPALLALWDAHAWLELFHTHAGAWARGDIAVVATVGHALLEHKLLPQLLLIGKCVAVHSQASDQACIEHVAARIADATLLNDPLELRPLPLSGIPGWDARNDDADFYRHAPCFSPLRNGRVYPPPLAMKTQAEQMQPALS